MLLLPRLDEPVSARGERSPCGGSPWEHTAPLKSVFHLCSKDGLDMASPQSTPTQQRRLSRGPEEPPAMSKMMASPRPKDTGARPLTPISSTRSTQRYNGVEGISLSQAGSWLDSRCFREQCEFAGANTKHSSRSARSIRKRRPGTFTESERFVLKRCKDNLLRRFGSLHVAFRRFDTNGSNRIALIELLEGSAGVVRPVDAKILYRLLDADCDEVVSLNELQSVLEAV